MLRETMAHYVSSLCRHATVSSGRRQRTLAERLGGGFAPALEQQWTSNSGDFQRWYRSDICYKEDAAAGNWPKSCIFGTDEGVL